MPSVPSVVQVFWLRLCGAAIFTLFCGQFMWFQCAALMILPSMILPSNGPLNRQRKKKLCSLRALFQSFPPPSATLIPFRIETPLPQRNASNSMIRGYAVFSLRFLRLFAANSSDNPDATDKKGSFPGYGVLECCRGSQVVYLQRVAFKMRLWGVSLRVCPPAFRFHPQLFAHLQWCL